MSDTPFTDKMQAMVIAHDEGDTFDPHKMVPATFCQSIERAYHAACAFIDCHVADPDITEEMCDAHERFMSLRKYLNESNP